MGGRPREGVFLLPVVELSAGCSLCWLLISTAAAADDFATEQLFALICPSTPRETLDLSPVLCCRCPHKVRSCSLRMKTQHSEKSISHSQHSRASRERPFNNKMWENKGRKIRGTFLCSLFRALHIQLTRSKSRKIRRHLLSHSASR